MIYQELTLAPHLTVEANVMLGQERASPAWSGAASIAGWSPRPWACWSIPTSGPRPSPARLSVGAQQLVEVARALVADARVIVFDEPTSSLTERDAERLFEVIERLRAEGWRSSTSATSSRRSAGSPSATRCSATAGPWPRGRWRGRNSRRSSGRWSAAT